MYCTVEDFESVHENRSRDESDAEKIAVRVDNRREEKRCNACLDYNNYNF